VTTLLCGSRCGGASFRPQASEIVYRACRRADAYTYRRVSDGTGLLMAA
jgi:hypothetical protein